MKKHVFSLGLMLVAALAFTNCAKQEVINDTPEQQPAVSAGVPFELTAGMDTKTATTDGATINWAANDALNVFVAEHDGSFSGNKKFTSTDGSKTFKGELDSALDGAKTYDWKVVYPYNEDILTVNTHDGNKGYLTLGSKTNATQTQSGNNNKAHLAGSHMPLYGVVKDVSGNDSPSVTLSQVMSVVKVHVTNATESPLVVSTVNVAAPAGTLISGTFFLDFSGDTPVFESSGASYTSNVAKLTVTDGDAIDKNGTADFYVAIKPFTQAAAGVLTVSINGYEKEITIPASTEFKPGKIKTVNFSYDKKNTVAELPFSIDGTAGSDAFSTMDGLSSAGLGSDYADSNSPYLTKFDSTGDYIQIHFNEPADKVSFEVKKIGGATNSTFTLGGSADGISFTDIETFEVTGAQGKTVSFISSVSINSDYRYLRLSFTKGANVGLGPFSVTKFSTDPVINVTSDNPMAVANTASTQTITYEVTNAVLGKSISAATEATWITEISTATNGKVTFNVAAQAPAAPARSADITLSYDGADKVVVTVNQAAGAGATLTSTLTFTAKCNGSGTADDGTSWTVTSDGLESNFDSNRGIHYGTNSASVEYIKLTTSDISGTITKIVVNASAASDATVSVKVDEAAFGGDPQSLSSSANDYTFNGSASGSIEVTVTKPSSAKKALYVKSVTVTYTPAP